MGTKSKAARTRRLGCLINMFFKFSPALYINCQYHRVPMVLIGSRNKGFFDLFLGEDSQYKRSQILYCLFHSFSVGYCCPGINDFFLICANKYVRIINGVIITMYTVVNKFINNFSPFPHQCLRICCSKNDLRALNFFSSRFRIFHCRKYGFCGEITSAMTEG